LKEVVENPQEFESCAVCARTILRGERVSEYVTPDGERLRVCSLCRARAEAAGWIPAEHAAAYGRPANRRGRGLALRQRIARAAERLRQPPARVPDATTERDRATAATAAGRAATSRDQREAGSRTKRGVPGARNGEAPTEGRRARPPAKPAPGGSEPAAKPQPARVAKRAEAAQARGADARTRPAPKPRPAPDTPERRMRRAVQRFNQSENPRVIAGLVRSLGAPKVTVRNVSARPPRVMITIAWELSWYRWEVGLNSEQPAIREVDKGKELRELDESERQWNARIGDEGYVRLGSAASQRSRPAGG
jgi:hypothetical protein